MVNKYIEVEIIENKEIAKDVYKLRLKGGISANAGQFFMVKGFEDKTMLPRPISLCDIKEGECTLLYLVVGKGTKILSGKKQGEKLEILGGLGNGFDTNVSKNEKIAVVSGGIGIAPMLNLVKNLNCKIDFYAGFRDEPYFIEELRPYVDNIFIATETGVQGHKGYIVDIIKDEYSKIFACGPTQMLSCMKNLDLHSKIYVSLESHMGCGIGACLACSCKTKRGMQRICKEGPVFDILEVEI